MMIVHAIQLMATLLYYYMDMHSWCGDYRREKMLQLLPADFFVIIFIERCRTMAIWSSNLGVSAKNGKMMLRGDESVSLKALDSANEQIGAKRGSTFAEFLESCLHRKNIYVSFI